jgi:benzoyl-CoA reductase subunit A
MSENSSINEQLDWKKAKVITAGVDVGAISTKAIVLLDGQVYASSQVKTIVPKDAADNAMKAIFDLTGLKQKDINTVMATGTGRTQVSFAKKTITEVACAAAGAVKVWGPSVRTVLDLGGQSCQVIQCTEVGIVNDFLWNDKCSAGIGRTLEVLADMANVDISELGNIAVTSEEMLRLSDFCSVFSISEGLDAMCNKTPAEEIIAGYHWAMALRICTLTRKIGFNEKVVIIGGMAKNIGITSWIEKHLGITRLAPKPEWDSTLTVALGAALFAGGNVS